MMEFAPGCFFWPSFCRSFPWSQLCRISENARWGSPWQIRHSSAPRALGQPRIAAKCCGRLTLEGNFSEDMMAFAPGCCFWPSFCRSFPWTQLCRISENARWGSPWQIRHSSAPPALGELRFAAKCCARLALKGNLSKNMMAFAPECILWPSFCRSFPWSQLCRISENARWGSPWQIRYSSAPPALGELRFAAKCCARLALQGNFSYDMMAFAPGCFYWPSFCRSFPWSQLCRISENARWGSPWQI